LKVFTGHLQADNCVGLIAPYEPDRRLELIGPAGTELSPLPRKLQSTRRVIHSAEMFTGLNDDPLHSAIYLTQNEKA
jgi:hypothetical protein